MRRAAAMRRACSAWPVAFAAAALLFAFACDKGDGGARDGGLADASDAGKKGSAKPSGSAKVPTFAPVPNAAPGAVWILSRAQGLLGIDATGKRTRIAVPDARVLDVATLTDGQTLVVESKGLRRVVGKTLVKVHAFGERMAADVEDGATALPGPNGALSIVGAKRIWHGGKPGWKGTGRSTVTMVVRDRAVDTDAAGTPLVWGIDADDELRFQRGDDWDPVTSLPSGLVLKSAVLAIAPAPSGGVYALREDGLFRVPGRTDPAALVAPLTATRGSTLAASTSGVVAIRDPAGRVTVVSPVGEVVTSETTLPAELAVDDLGRVWFSLDGAIAVLAPGGLPTKLPRTGDVADVAQITASGAGPPKDKLVR